MKIVKLVKHLCTEVFFYFVVDAHMLNLFFMITLNFNMLYFVYHGFGLSQLINTRLRNHTLYNFNCSIFHFPPSYHYVTTHQFFTKNNLSLV